MSPALKARLVTSLHVLSTVMCGCSSTVLPSHVVGAHEGAVGASTSRTGNSPGSLLEDALRTVLADAGAHLAIEVLDPVKDPAGWVAEALRLKQQMVPRHAANLVGWWYSLLDYLICWLLLCDLHLARISGELGLLVQTCL